MLYKLCFIKYLCVILQYGRQNIESVRKKNGTWNPNKEFNTEGKSESPTKIEKNATTTFSDTQDGSLGNTVIARSDLILVPEPDVQNHKNHVDKSELGSSDHPLSTINDNDKQVNL